MALLRLYFCLYCMSKPLIQIAFDFSATPGPGTPPVADTPVPAGEVPIQVPAEPLITEEDIPVSSAGFSAAPARNRKKAGSTRGRRSLKEAGLSAELLDIPDDETLFQKQYYAIGEVAAMFREKQSLIRYWETEFDILQPRKNRKGDRFFRPVDVKNLVLIYDLLRRRKFTIEGAKDFLKKNKKAEEKFAMIRSLEKIRQFFLELKANL